MRKSFFIARRYLYSRAKYTFIHYLSFFSVGMVGVGSAALIISLSAFNGMEALLRKQYVSFDPVISLRAHKGYTFSLPPTLASYLADHPQIESYSPILEDDALASYRGKQKIIKLRGIDPTFFSGSLLQKHLIRGDFTLQVGDKPQAVMGVGVRYAMALPLRQNNVSIQIFYPTTAVGFDVRRLYRVHSVPVAGTFALNHVHDEKYVFVPLDFAQKVVANDSIYSSVALRLEAGTEPKEVAAQVEAQFGSQLKVLTREQQHTTLYQLLHIEKMFVFVIFSLVLLAASLGLFFVLIMLFLSKKKDFAILIALGASPWFLRKIFIYESALISGIGCVLGLFVGISLCYLQKKYGLVDFGLNANGMHYPIEVRVEDIIQVVVCSIGLTVVSVLRPIWLAGKVRTHRIKFS